MGPALLLTQILIPFIIYLFDILEGNMEYLILGLLILSPMTGYELQQFIKKNLALICSQQAQAAYRPPLPNWKRKRK